MTLVNVYHRQELKTLLRSTRPDVYRLFSTGVDIYDPFDTLFCSMKGFKCENRNCHCAHYCKGNYAKYHIYESDEVIISNERLTPGTYCLPRGLDACNTKTTRPIYSVNGWQCINKNSAVWKGDVQIACQSHLARNNAENYIYDHKYNVEADQRVTDYFEVYNGTLRYGCKCNSLDLRGNRMLALDEIPFTCVTDYCLKNISNSGLVGWDPVTKTCDCSGFPHEVANDLTSPCASVRSRVRNDVLVGQVPCQNLSSFEPKAIRCPMYRGTDNFISFETRVGGHSNPLDFIS